MDIQVILNMSTLNNKVAKISYERRIDQANDKGEIIDSMIFNIQDDEN